MVKNDCTIVLERKEASIIVLGIIRATIHKGIETTPFYYTSS